MKLRTLYDSLILKLISVSIVLCGDNVKYGLLSKNFIQRKKQPKQYGG